MIVPQPKPSTRRKTAVVREAMKKIGCRRRARASPSSDLKKADKKNSPAIGRGCGGHKDPAERQRRSKPCTRLGDQGAGTQAPLCLQRPAEGLRRRDIGLPAIIPSFTLGGTGGGIAYRQERIYRNRAERPRRLATTEVLIEKAFLAEGI